MTLTFIGKKVVAEKEFDLEIKTITAEMRLQRGNQNENYDLQFKTLTVWETSGQPISFQCYAMVDMVASAYAPHILFEQESVAPNRVQYARLHFRWPKSENAIPTDGTDNNLLARILINNKKNAGELVIHLKLRYKIAGGAPMLRSNRDNADPGVDLSDYSSLSTPDMIAE